jgi:hypothetical protein
VTPRRADCAKGYAPRRRNHIWRSRRQARFVALPTHRAPASGPLRRRTFRGWKMTRNALPP